MCFIPYEPTKKWLLHWIVLYIIVRNISKESYCRIAVRVIAPTIFLYHPDQLVPRFIPLWYFPPAFLPSLRSAYWMPHGKFLQIKDSMCSEANSFFETSTSSLVAKRKAFANATCLWRESFGSEIYLWKVMFSRANHLHLAEDMVLLETFSSEEKSLQITIFLMGTLFRRTFFSELLTEKHLSLTGMFRQEHLPLRKEHY